MAVRASPESGGGTAGRGFEPPFGSPPVLRSAPKKPLLDRLSKRNKLVESAYIAGVPSPEKMTGAWHARAVLHARPLALGAWGRVEMPKNSGKIVENRENYFMEVRAISL